MSSRSAALATTGLLAGLVGVAAGLVQAAYPAAVAEGEYSYPFTPGGFAVLQTVLTGRDLAIAAAIVGIWVSGALGRSAMGRIGVIGAAGSMTVLAAMEVASIVVKDEGAVGAGFGLATLAAGLFMILTGIAVARVRIWTGWRRFVPLACGVYTFVPLTPAIVAGFIVGQLAIAGWMALFALVGLAMRERS